MSNKKQPPNTIILHNHSQVIYIDADPPLPPPNNNHPNISQLPAFQTHTHHLTKLFYSKLIVKNINTLNTQHMIKALKAKRVNSSKGKGRQKKAQVVRDERERQLIVVPQGGGPNLFTNDRYSNSKADGKSSGVFQINQRLFTLNNKDGRPKSAFQRSSSNKNVHRPQSSVVQQEGLRNRPHSALNRTHSAKVMRNRVSSAFQRSNSAKKLWKTQSIFDTETIATNSHNKQDNNEIQRASNLLTISDSSKIKTTDFIHKNIRETSLRKSTLYITSCSQNRVKSVSKLKIGVQRRGQALVREGVSKEQREEIKRRNVSYLQFMKQKMPLAYAQCVNYLCNMDQPSSTAFSIFSSNLHTCQPLGLTQVQQEEMEVKQYYQNFYNQCIDTQYNLKPFQKLSTKPTHHQYSLINIHQSQHIQTIYQHLTTKKANSQHYSKELAELKTIIKDLQFFKSIKEDAIEALLLLNFSIQRIDEGVEMIREGDEIGNVYIILNGSVKKVVGREQSFELHQFTEMQMGSTLFDGQIFGIPTRGSHESLNYSITTIQQSLLMIIPYSQFKQTISSNQHIEDKIELLTLILSHQQAHFKINREDYENIAFQLETQTYAAKQIIYRQGDPCENVLFFASGNASICLESLITRKKDNKSPLLKSKSAMREGMGSVRRKNLFNYELLDEDKNELRYYYNEPQGQKIRGDSLNWKGFHHRLKLPQSTAYLLPYSIISNHDNTTIYSLSPNTLQLLSQHIRYNLMQISEALAGSQTIQRRQQEFNKWEEYKQKLSSSILKAKKNRPF